MCMYMFVCICVYACIYIICVYACIYICIFNCSFGTFELFRLDIVFTLFVYCTVFRRFLNKPKYN